MLYSTLLFLSFYMDFGIAETGITRGSPPGTTTEVLRFGVPFAEIRVVSLASTTWSNRRFLSESRSSKLCSRERRCLGPEAHHGAGPTAPVGPIAPARLVAPVGSAVPGGSTVPSTCGILVPISPKMCTYLQKSQHNSWNFISTKNVHEICHILLSNLRFWRSNFFVRTVNKLPQAKRLLVLEQSLDLALVDQELHDVTTRQEPVHKSMLYFLFEKIGMREI
jgi:hypothetical protein